MDEHLTIKLGQFIRVDNKNRKTLENEIYIAIQVEDQDGDNERCLLFTQIELADVKGISTSNWFVKQMVPGRLYLTTIGRQSFYLMKIFNSSEDEKVIKISKRLLHKAEKRAEKNPEDLTKKPLYIDMFD